jgi:hypothetical protein
MIGLGLVIEVRLGAQKPPVKTPDADNVRPVVIPPSDYVYALALPHFHSLSLVPARPVPPVDYGAVGELLWRFPYPRLPENDSLRGWVYPVNISI